MDKLHSLYWRRFLLLNLIAWAIGLSACGLVGGPDASRGKTLADLPEAQLPSSTTTIDVVDSARIEQSYQKALQAAAGPELRQQINVRLADLEMMRSEQAQLSATDARRFYDKPIMMYRELLAQQDNNPAPVKGVVSDQLRYKLAKALALDGRTEEAAQVLDELAKQDSQSPFMAETQFRRAEKAFADGNYRAAEQRYADVVSGNNPALQQNALYMKGWSQFKQGDYDLALQSFAQVLDQLLGVATAPQHIQKTLADVGAAKANLVQDSLRVMALSLSYLQGAPSIVEMENQLGGSRAYSHLLYMQLGELLLEQKRFTDSADTYQHFVTHNPQSDLAPGFSIKAIEVYQQGDFPSLIIPAKQNFVQRYGRGSQFWQARQGLLDEQATRYLHQSLRELASYEHAEAQALAARHKPDAGAAFARAAAWYREFVQTFPADPSIAEMTFLLAESLSEAGDLPGAVDAYERVAYTYRDKTRGPDAGYSAILLTQRHVQQLAQAKQADVSENQGLWQTRNINNILLFAEHYPRDARVPAVLTEAATKLLQQQRFAEAKAVADRVITWQPTPEGSLLFTSWLVLGHSYFELKDYAPAEQAYQQVLLLWTAYGSVPGAPSAQQVRERLAASIYQQAEAKLAAGEPAAAIQQLLRIAQVAPDTDIAAKAQYDAGAHLMEQQQWAQAERVYLRFRQQYGQHHLAATLPAKLVLIYQNQSKWPQAASELVTLERTSTDPEVKRQSLYMGAELYEKSGQVAQALEHYRRYVNDYPRPLANNLEAQYHLTELYRAQNNSSQRAYWLQYIINTHQRAGREKTERSTYLAAQAHTELAQPAYDEFARIPLTLPLKNSLQRKRTALANALKIQEQVLAYGVSEFTTQASFKIGEIYAQLSRDLMASQRPAELDALALEQYDILLEEQAYPFEEKAIDIHQVNAQRSWSGTYDPWVKRSFDALSRLLPARYNKPEARLEVSRDIH